jgi:hypothetical protein
VDGTKGTKPDTLSEALLIIYDREGAEMSHGLVEAQSARQLSMQLLQGITNRGLENGF